MALSKEVTYQELIQLASGQEVDSISAMAPAPAAAATMDWFDAPTQKLSVTDSMKKISLKLDGAAPPDPKDLKPAGFKRMSTFSLTSASAAPSEASAPPSAPTASLSATEPATAAPAATTSPEEDTAALATLGEGCYLTFEDVGGGTLCQNWSKSYKSGALAFFTTKRTGMKVSKVVVWLYVTITSICW
jgi:hypothetical protein